MSERGLAKRRPGLGRDRDASELIGPRHGYNATRCTAVQVRARLGVGSSAGPRVSTAPTGDEIGALLLARESDSRATGAAWTDTFPMARLRRSGPCSRRRRSRNQRSKRRATPDDGARAEEQTRAGSRRVDASMRRGPAEPRDHPPLAADRPGRLTGSPRHFRTGPSPASQAARRAAQPCRFRARRLRFLLG